MKKLKKFMALLICMAMLCLILPQLPVSAAASGACGESLTWTLDDSGTLTISGTGDMSDWSWNQTAPWYSSRDLVKTVVISDGVTSIGDYAFEGCSSLTSVTIPNSVTSIAGFAFFNCESLSSVTIPDGVTSIGEEAFLGCKSLTSIAVDLNNPSYASIDGVLFNKGITNLIQYPAGSTITEYTVPDSVNSIGNLAFAFCSSLTSVSISDSVNDIGISAFVDCTSLSSVTIPDSVTYIDSSAFGGCPNLTSIAVDPNNPSYASIDGVLFNKGITNLIQYPAGSTITEYTIPDGVTSINNWTFAYCTSLSSVIIPDSVTYIGDWAFVGCTSLSSVTIPDSVTYIGISAFAYCTSLASVTIPDSVTYIDRSAFGGCSNLTSIAVDPNNPSYASIDGVLFNKDTTKLIQYPVGSTITEYTIPDGVTSIDNWTFSDCSNLSSITISDSVSSIGNWAFDGCPNLTSIAVDPNNPNYASIDGVLFNKDTTNLIQYPIGSTITEYTVPDSVTSIGDSAFDGCINLSSVTIPDGVTSIGSYAFYKCSNLTNIVIGNSVTSIGDYVFSGCESLPSVTIPDGVISIGDSAFDGCSSLASVTIPDSVISIGIFAFYGCISLSSVTVPDGVTSIGYSVFSDCTSLSSITIPDSVISIDDFAFDGCTSLASVTIPDSVTSIGMHAFYRCSNLTDVYYGGSEESRENISIDIGNENLTNATIHYGTVNSKITVVLNGNELSFEQPPVIENDRTLVPLRAIFEALGAEVSWDNDTRTVTSVKNSTTIQLTIGSNILYKNQAAIYLDVPAQLIGDYTMVPVRAVYEAFGAEVSWDADTYTVYITAF